jgi:alpha-glucuronidase
LRQHSPLPQAVLVYLRMAALAALLVATNRSSWLHADTAYDAWLRYPRLGDRGSGDPGRPPYRSLPDRVVVLGNSDIILTAQGEMLRGVRGMLGKSLRAESRVGRERAIILGTLAQFHRAVPGLKLTGQLSDDGFWLKQASLGGFECLIVAGATERGVLYGVFRLLRKLALGDELTHLDERQEPSANLRWVDQWDNLDGTIERGYAGGSIFFEHGQVRSDLSRASDYARLLASLGIKGCVINNVNANPRTLADDFLPQLARIADAFRPWGVQLGLAANFASPKQTGGLETFDPLDPAADAWWRHKADQIYQQIPDFGGFVMKADSEGQMGPSAYLRTPSDAANVIARALKPHGGILFYRAFVYNHHLDWTNPRNDRARAAYDLFHPLDGQFDDNIVVQIKNGPIDFQVREPVSPLFAGLTKTNQAIELEITQEYTGQQRHLCFLAPMWKEILDFDMQAARSGTPLKNLVTGRAFHRRLGGFVGVSNVGMDPSWLGNPLAMANLYAFGRLAWNPDLSASALVDEWTRLTFGHDPLVVGTIWEMQLASWRTYENYTGPLGLQTLTNILGSHYGPGVESSERNGWGQWHRADHHGAGMDRSVASGTGFAGQYPPGVAKMYESLSSTPDDLLLFFHHVPYTYKLHSGETVIQRIYDAHYEGAERAAAYVQQWVALRNHVDGERYAAVLELFKYQAGHAIVWRDAVSDWFFRASGISDVKGRVGNYPDRIEAEAMQLEGYAPVEISPKENASGGRGVECAAAAGVCAARFRFARPTGKYEFDVQYFDQNNGKSKFRVLVNGQKIDEWVASDQLPATEPNGDSSTRRSIRPLWLRTGDNVCLEGVPDGEERAPLDYVEIDPLR